MPATDGDIWLAAAFADFEKIVSMEKEMEAKAHDGKPSTGDEGRLALSLFSQRERYQSAVRRLGKDQPIHSSPASMRESESYDIAAGKGVLFLSHLRSTIGAEKFDALMDEFGRAHAGKPASTKEFRAAIDKVLDPKQGNELVANWLFKPGLPGNDDAQAWSVTGFYAEPEKAMIVYGTTREEHAQHEAALILQDKIARRAGYVLVPIKKDTDVTDDELKSGHILLIGRPGTNAIVSRLASDLPVAFGSGSFQVGDKTYANARTAIAAAGANPLHPVAVLAGRDRGPLGRGDPAGGLERERLGRGGVDGRRQGSKAHDPARESEGRRGDRAQRAGA